MRIYACTQCADGRYRLTVIYTITCSQRLKYYWDPRDRLIGVYTTCDMPVGAQRLKNYGDDPRDMLIGVLVQRLKSYGDPRDMLTGVYTTLKVLLVPM